MAKALARRAPTVRVVIPKASKAGALARRGASAAAREAANQRHMLVALGAAAALGYTQRAAIALPHVQALGVAGTYGLAAYALGRGLKSRTAEHAATGLLAIAVCDLVRGGFAATRTAGVGAVLGADGSIEGVL